VFAGALLLALIYSTRPDGQTSMTLARSGDTSLVVDTTGTSDSAALPADSAVDSLRSEAPDDASPLVIPADLALLKSESLIIPVAGVVAKDLTDSFDDMRGGTRHHNALDIMAARNTPVLATVNGRILKLHNSVAGGLTIYESDPSSRFVMMYGHLDSYRPGLVEGAAVKRGDLIGFVGSTGNASPGAPHLHFQITRSADPAQWWKGTPVNPFPIFRPQG
jgi:peptidoglycan LD-endopeptidase LytH